MKHFQETLNLKVGNLWQNILFKVETKQAIMQDLISHANISKKEMSAHLMRLEARSSITRQTSTMLNRMLNRMLNMVKDVMNLETTFVTFVMFCLEPKMTL